MSETNVLCENFPRTNSSSSISNVVNTSQDSNGNIRSPATIPDNLDTSKSKLSFLENLDRDRRSPREFQVHRRNSSHGLDLSKSHPSSPTDGINGLDLTKQELPSPNSFSRSSDPTPFTNGIPTPTQMSYGPSRSHSAGEVVSPFRSDPTPNGYSPDNLTNGDYKNTFLESYGRSIDSTSNRFPEGYSSKVFDPITSPPGMMTSSAASPTYPTKMSDSFIAAKLAENSPFPKPQDPYSKLLEDYCNNAKNNNNNISGSKLNDDYSDICGKMSDSPYKKIAESYVKQIESLANGYKSDVGIFKHENSLSPESFKSDPPTFGILPKSDPSLTNGGSTFGSTADSVTSSSQPSGQSLPSIINFSTNHLRGIGGVDSGLSGFLNSYGVGGDSRGDRGDSRGGGGREIQGGGGGNGNDSNISRASPNNKLACRFCGKTFSQAGYIKAHERLHTGEKPFACSVCGKRFSDPSNWKKHERVHANNKKPGGLLDSQEAKVCGRTFAQSGSYRMHERRHMTDAIQRCHICYATFTSWQDLQRHMASHPQVTQAILEFEEGNQGILTCPNPGDLGGQLGDGSIGQLGQPDVEGQGHGHVLLPGDCGGQRDMGVHHPRCPPPLIPESLLMDSEAAAFHVQSQGLYHSPGQLPPFSSIIPFRHHPGGPPAFPPSFPPGLGLLGPQSLPVTSHADLLTKHPFFGAMMGATQMKHNHAFSKLSPTYSPQQQQLPQHHLLHQQQQHQQQRPEQQQQHHHQHHQQHEHGVGDGTDVVSTTSASKRADQELRNSSRSYTPEERSDNETATNLKDDKDSSAFARSVSSDDGLHSPDDNHMENNGDDEMLGNDQDMAENENDEDTDVDDRGYTNEREYSSTRRFPEDEGRGGRERGERERDRERESFRKRNRSFESGNDKDRRDYKKERSPSGESGEKHASTNRGRDFDYPGSDRKRGYDQDRGYDQPKNGRNNRHSINRYIQSLSENGCSRENNDKSSSLSGSSNNNSHGINDRGSINANDSSDLRPPKRHIERQNLNTRMIPSSSSRKQRHPMRRFSSAGSEQESPQSTSSLPVTSTTVEAIERGDLDDNDLVTFLLTKGRVHKCVHCHMIFEDASLFLLHNGFHSHDDPFRCVVCSTACKDRIDFNCHLTSHIK